MSGIFILQLLKLKGGIFVAITLKAMLSNSKKLTKELASMPGNAEKVVEYTVKDFHARMPAQVTKAVREVYNIPAARINKAKAKDKGVKGNNIKLGGKIVANEGIAYKDNLLTVTKGRFSMKPGSRPKNNKSYRISTEIIKGQTKSLSKNAFLGTIYSPDANGSTYIGSKGGQVSGRVFAMQRTGKIKDDGRESIEIIRTLSVPQMISNEKVAPLMDKPREELINKRMEHHRKRLLGL